MTDDHTTPPASGSKTPPAAGSKPAPVTLVFLKQHHCDGRTYRPARTETSKFGKAVSLPADTLTTTDQRLIAALTGKGIAVKAGGK